MALDPRHIGLMLSIAQHGSFSAAAAALNTSQPALSNRIALLERELGAKVFDRGRYGVSLTETGRLLLRHARAMHAVLAQARQEVELKKLGKEGSVVVGATSIATCELVPRALAQFTQSRMALSLMESAWDEVLMDKLQAGELDLVVGTLGFGTTPASVHEELLTEMPFAVAVGAGNKLASRRSISLRELVGRPWALPPPGGAYRRYLEAIFLNNGVPFPAEAWTFDTAASLKAAVQHTECVAIIPKHAIRVEEKAKVLRTLKLIDPSPARPIGVMHLRSRPLSPIAERFMDALRQVARSIRLRGHGALDRQV